MYISSLHLISFHYFMCCVFRIGSRRAAGSVSQRAWQGWHVLGVRSFTVSYYYYYYRKKRFRWRNVERLQGHLTNAKDSDKMRVRRKVRTEYLSDAIVGRAVEIRKTSTEQCHLQLTSKGCQWRQRCERSRQAVPCPRRSHGESAATGGRKACRRDDERRRWRGTQALKYNNMYITVRTK